MCAAASRGPAPAQAQPPAPSPVLTCHGRGEQSLAHQPLLKQTLVQLPRQHRAVHDEHVRVRGGRAEEAGRLETLW